MSGLERVELGQGLTDEQITALRNRADDIENNTKVHLGPDAVKEVLNSEAMLYPQGESRIAKAGYSYEKGEVVGWSWQSLFSIWDGPIERFRRLMKRVTHSE